VCSLKQIFDRLSLSLTQLWKPRSLIHVNKIDFFGHIKIAEHLSNLNLAILIQQFQIQTLGDSKAIELQTIETLFDRH
jgi:hypothetical protein